MHVLLAYVVASFFASPIGFGVAVLCTSYRMVQSYLSTFVAILGTTISPYLFFWQASQEVEEGNSAVKPAANANHKDPTDEELTDARNDVVIGMFFSNLVMYFIILTTAATLHASGQRHIETAQQAAEALRPLAGDAAYLLFTVGLIGTGNAAVPVSLARRVRCRRGRSLERITDDVLPSRQSLCRYSRRNDLGAHA